MRTAASALALAALLLAACAGGDEAGIEASALPRLVLQPADLGPDYRRFDEGKLAAADAPRGLTGWKARYRWAGPDDAAVPLVVESRVDLYESSGEAGTELEKLVGGLEGETLEAPDVGDGAHAVTFVRPGLSSDVRFYVVAWRDRNVTAAVTVNGFDDRVAAGDALELARKQARRIAGAG